MFEVGFTEIILILGLALLVLGPEKLPGLAEKVGRWTGRARAMARQLRTQLEHEVTLDELAKSRPAPASPPESRTGGHAGDAGAAKQSAPADAGLEIELDAMVAGGEPAMTSQIDPAAAAPGSETPTTKPAR